MFLFRGRRAALLVLLGMMLAAAPGLAATVKITVNGQAITDIQISQRVALHRLEGKSNRKGATDELVNEALQLQEAKRAGIAVSETEVDNAILDVARNIKLSESNLRLVLSQNGVPIQTLRDRLRANIAWGRVVSGVISPRVKVSEVEVDAKAKERLTAVNSFDYVLKEVLFVTPGGKSVAQRTADAKRYAKGFAGCDGAVDLSLGFTDAAVRNVGRRHATQLPPGLAAELAKLDVGGITKPRTVEGGVSLLAVCAKTAAEDTTFIAGEIRQEVGGAGLKTEVEKYLADLRAKAQIIGG